MKQDETFFFFNLIQFQTTQNIIRFWSGIKKKAYLFMWNETKSNPIYKKKNYNPALISQLNSKYNYSENEYTH